MSSAAGLSLSRCQRVNCVGSQEVLDSDEVSQKGRHGHADDVTDSCMLDEISLTVEWSLCFSRKAGAKNVLISAEVLSRPGGIIGLSSGKGRKVATVVWCI